MLVYLSADIICSKKQTLGFKEQIMSKDKISEHIFGPNGGYMYCVCYPLLAFKTVKYHLHIPQVYM